MFQFLKNLNTFLNSNLISLTDMSVAVLDEQKDLKCKEMKEKWREFCNEFKHVEDFSFGCLLRLDSAGEYSEANSR